MGRRSARSLQVLALSASLVVGGTGAAGSAPDQQPGDAETEFPPPAPDLEGDIDPDRPTPPLISPTAAEIRQMRFPVNGQVSYVETFGACRDGCRRYHQGNDIFAPKLTHLLAARDGHVTWFRTDASGTAGNGIGITDAEGWRYLYLHVNNDSPGTDDGRNPARWRFATGIRMGTKVYAGQIIGYLGDSGNAETTPPHVHFELRRPDGVNISPYSSLQNASRARPDPRFYRFDRLRLGPIDDHVQFGTAAGASNALACDVDGDGDDEPVVHIANRFVTAVSITDLRVASRPPYGIASDRAVCGDWDGNGTDTVGVFRDGLWMLRNDWRSGYAHISFSFGRTGDRPIVGDWNGDGIDTVGVVRGRHWYLTNVNRAGPGPGPFVFGSVGDRPYPGDWNGDGVTTAGVRRGATTYIRNQPGGGPYFRAYTVGYASDWAVVASWPTSEVGRADSISLWRRYPR